METEYLNLVRDVLDNGHWKDGRNGRTKEVFGRMIRFPLENGTLPLLTTKYVSWPTVLRELLFFVRGQTDNRILNAQGVHIWDANCTREFLDSRGLQHYPEGCLGPNYGHQWRNFNAKYQISSDIESESKSGEFDQLMDVIQKLKDPSTRNDRRLIVTAWNPCQLHEMALPPCHVMFQFSVMDDKLSCLMTQRSADIGLGLPFNIASYALLTHMIAKHCGLHAHELIISIGSAHIYEQHIEPLMQQISRSVYQSPTLEISEVKENIEDYCVEDFKVKGYKFHPRIRMEMIA